jgi:hypothetical protein
MNHRPKANGQAAPAALPDVVSDAGLHGSRVGQAIAGLADATAVPFITRGLAPAKEASMPAQTRPAETTNLFLLEDLDDVERTSEVAESDLEALHAVADWIRTFVVEPHKDLGRAGTVCPFVPGSLERKTLWLAPEQIADRDVPEVVELMNGYKRLLLDTRPTGGDDVIYNVIVVVFSDLPAERAQGVFDDVLKHLAVPSYVEDGILFGPYYEGNEGTAIYNSSFRPFQSPVPFLFVRHGVTGDWKFFLDDDEWLDLWARRYGESAVQALAEELRRLPWRAQRQ